MLEQKFNKNWKYWINKDSFSLIWDVPKEARSVTLPHDAMIEKEANVHSPNKGNTGFRDGDIYNYVNCFFAPEEYEDKTIMLKFEGIYMNAFVFVNGQLAGKNHFGYSTFFVPLNDFLRYGGENEIRVQVRNGAMTNSRWYSGGGIYRDVYLLVSDVAYIVPEGIQIKTEAADERYAVLKISTELKSRDYRVRELMLETTIQDNSGNIAAKESFPITLLGQEERKIVRRMTVEHPQLWSETSPNLYTCMTRLMEKGNILDEISMTFGIRTLLLDAKRGLKINGQAVKLRGACIHHDSGLLGAATYEGAQFGQVKKLKEAGFNAIRMAHHPMAPAMLRACDKLGVYVMDETFDMWQRCKSDYDYGMYFEESWEKDVEAMVRKDYNHPSVVMYSIGNEIPEIGTNQGTRICHDLCKKIRSLDDSRYTLASINGVFAAGEYVDEIVADVSGELKKQGKMEGNVNDFMSLMAGYMDDIVIHKKITECLEKACAYTDIAGYNYMAARYEADGKDYPDRVIVGSETYPPEIARNWDLVKKCNHVIGDFTWTGWDYIGESGVGIPAYQFGEGGFGAGFPCQLAYSGDIDITGFRRPVSYYREIVFGKRTIPYIAVQNPAKYGQKVFKTPWVLSDSICSWTWKGYEEKPVIVEVYAPGTEVELFLNGISLGKKESGMKVSFRTLFETTYQPGTLTAVVFEEGQEISRETIKTAQRANSLALDGEWCEAGELLYINICVCDFNGIVVTDEDMEIIARISGGAKLVGFGSGNPKPRYNYNQTKTETYQGHALLILKKEESGGPISVEMRGIKEMKTEAIF